VVLYEFAMIGLIDAFLHARDEACLVFEHATHRLCHQLLSVLATGRGHLLEPHLNVRRKVHFQIPSLRWFGLQIQARALP
jgi:hypothetical protein